MSQYQILGSPIRINKMWLKNRISFPPINECQSNENGAPTEAMCAYYAARAKGGAALVNVGSTTITPDSRNHGAQGQLSDSKYIPPYSHLVDAVHRYGAKISIELNHFGAEASIKSEKPNLSSSNVCARDARYIKSMDLDELHEIQRQYVQSVIWAKQAGFDAVTFHAAHGNIMPQFFSTLYNKRTDWYGGFLENRIRFAREIVEMAREAVGPNFPLIMRISGDEYIEGGRTLEETVEICKAMEKAGIDCFDVSGGLQATYLYSIMPGNLPGMHGFMMPSAQAIKAAVSVPVIGAGGIRTAAHAEQLLKDGYADMISFGRAFLADADFGNKVFEGREEEIRPCLSCLHCFARTGKDQFLTCAVNPECGREQVLGKLEKAEEEKRILVVGGGPAGLEAARICAMRGYAVTLIEKQERLGGSVYAAGVPMFKGVMHDLIGWYERQLCALRVDIRLHTAYHPTMAKDYDVVFDAVGASYMRFIKGADGSRVITAIEALTDPVQVGEKVVVIGGGSTGCEVAEFFGACEYTFTTNRMKDFSMEMIIEKKHEEGKHNRDVTIVEMMPELCGEREKFSRKLLLKQLEINGVKTMLCTKVHQVREDGVVEVIDMKAGDLIELEADTVILAGGMKPESIEVPIGIKHIKIGDTVLPSTIANAVFTAHCAARDV